MGGYVRYIAIMGGILAGLPCAQAQSPGDWVLARGKGGQHWLFGVVEKAWGNRITVQYDGNDREDLNFTEVRRYNWTVGSPVECRSHDDLWRPATIAALAGERLWIIHEDGSRATTVTGRCRSD